MINMKENTQKNEREYQTLGKRFLAFLIDASSIFILLLIMFSFIGVPVLKHTPIYQSYLQENTNYKNKMEYILIN